MDGMILVAGATGGTGQQVVSRLLKRGLLVRALVRDHDKGRALLGENLELVLGDTRRIDTLPDAVRGAAAVICVTGTRQYVGDNAPEHVDFEGVSNLVHAAVQAGVGRFVLTSSIGATQPEHPLNQYGGVLRWKHQGEQAVREAGIRYTIVRPGGLTDDPAGRDGLVVSQGDTLNGRISRGDVAEVLVRVLDDDRLVGVTFEIIGEPRQTTAWETLFDALKPA